MKSKRIKTIFLIVIILCFLSGCGFGDSDNPLSGKNIDERVIMCLEIRYPEHQFHVVESFDRTKNSGIYADESGREFVVRNLLYNNGKHFGCYDEYLYTRLKEQNFEETALQIGMKYGQRIEVSPSFISIDFWIEDILEQKISMRQAAEIILEILNCVEAPTVTMVEKEGFSTNEINYYTKPVWGGLIFSFDNKNGTLGVGYNINFSKKEESVESIEKELSTVFNRIYEYEEYANLKENDDFAYEAPKYETGTSVETDFGCFVLPKGWSLNENYSTEEFNLYMKEGTDFQDESSYFVIGCTTNPYTVDQHVLFKKRILFQLTKNENLPKGKDIEIVACTTQNGNIVYSFSIVMSDNKEMTMHYIVGNKRHCLVQEIEYKKTGEYTFTEVRRLINSFLWKE